MRSRQLKQHNDYFYFQLNTTSTPQLCPSVLNHYVINEHPQISTWPNKLKKASFNLSTKNFTLQTFNLLWYTKLIKSYFMLRNTYQHIDFKNTLEFLIDLCTNKYTTLYPSSLFSKYSSYQLQLIKNKKMQNSWMSRNSLQLLELRNYATLNINKNFPLLKFRGFEFSVKGRAADLRWVKLRIRTFGYFKKVSFLDVSASNWESTDIFVTKWGSVSIKVRSSTLKFIKDTPNFYL